MSYLYPLSAAVLIWLSGCTDSTPLSKTQLVGGQNDVDNLFDSVLAWTAHGDDIQTTKCSGTKISHRLILTAFHCLRDTTWLESSPWIPWGKQGSTRRTKKRREMILKAMGKGQNMSYLFSSTTENPTELLTISNVHIMPRLLASLEGVGDCAPNCFEEIPLPDVVILEVEPEGSFARAPIAPIDFYPVRPEDPIFLTGYGSVGRDHKGPTIRQYSEHFVSSSEDLKANLVGTTLPKEWGDIDFHSNFFGVLGNLLHPQLSNLGSGDSGGPVFSRRLFTATAKDSIASVVGINSFGFFDEHPDEQRSRTSFFQRIDSFSPYGVGQWIQQVMDLAEVDNSQESSGVECKKVFSRKRKL